MTLGQLRTFREVARAGSINGAAAALLVTPPTVSSTVAALRDEVGAELVERDGRGIRLTPAGEALARYAAEILGLVDRVGPAVREAAGGPGHLRLVVVTTAGESVVPQLLAAFRERRPEAGISLEVTNRATLIERLLRQEADVGIGGRPLVAGVDGEAFLDNELVVIAPPDHPAVGRRRKVDATDLADETWLLREPGSGTRETTLEFLREHDVEPAARMTVGSNGAIVAAVALGLGVTLTSTHAVGDDLAAGRVARLPVQGTPLARPWYLLWAQDASLPPVADEFRAMLRDPPAAPTGGSGRRRGRARSG